MKAAGIDIGSRTIKTVLLDDGVIQDWDVADATSSPLETARAMLAGYRDIPVMATGYGRHLFEIETIPSVTEIKACARGVRHLLAHIRTIIDIGGQDLKVISLDAGGKVTKFEMNDRCAAGTGKFLEIMAQKLDYRLEDFGIAALNGTDLITISSLCAVFAESEVISLLNKNEPREDIARAIHRSVVNKISGMCKRVMIPGFPVCLAGGGAFNPAIRKLLKEKLETDIASLENPQIVTALGASLIASENKNSPQTKVGGGVCESI